ncbi:MAG: Na(+)-translocating NADH-quinone reductase subunit A [Bacteroidales bacterium]|nr:Na(+)-translocating NADH-quinone reductase subunit A [Bacteroidales bacterium]MCF8344607.1 Na(+)-translocating NADH-quinone reductase subunit A [Bacteroidales bacterium]MCF8352514.1 Na(+)-translocating NADH-quinone reductase subunit A [Bacteroidales bacterium]MCF8375513.1 Na(+)-translocating NADH-quinone reductase subunit A [Bacteroidales bacterium]MCF8399912.1 Na(+)-translocating NADH-quinone reductase subunit A [Bacteroidales bacterium]
MPNKYKIKKGLDIKLLGEAEKVIKDFQSDYYALKPTDFHGVFPKMLVGEGDKVKAGSPVFYDKYRDETIFTSPVSGTIEEVRRGPKRLLMEIRIKADTEIEYEDFGSTDPGMLSREKIIEKMLKSGVWPMIRQRPYSVIANPKDTPKAIFISGFDSSPLAPDFDLIVHGHGKEFQAGLDTLRKLTDGKLHLNIEDVEGQSKVFLNSKNVELNAFSGPHPAGNISTQVQLIDPVNKGDVVWYLRPQEVISIGTLFLEGKFDAKRIVALTGSEVLKTGYLKTHTGACIEKMVDGNTTGIKKRYISGNVLTGAKIERNGFISFYDSQITVIPEGDEYEFFGWAAPGLKKYSFYNAFLSKIFPGKKYRLNTNLHGGERAYVLTGQYEKVFPMDIYPMQLLKAIMTEDIDMMEQLGIYEIDEEDFALCEYIDVSKTDMQSIVREGINLMRKEME